MTKHDEHFDYIISIIVSCFLLFVGHTVIKWHFLITPNYRFAIYPFDLALSLNLAMNLVFLIFYNELRFETYLKIITKIFFIYFLFIALFIFPFNFAYILRGIDLITKTVFVKALIIIGIIGFLVGIIFDINILIPGQKTILDIFKKKPK
jgi:hypothetical protein